MGTLSQSSGICKPGGGGGGGERKLERAQQSSLGEEEEPAVTSRKLGLPLGGEKVRAVGPCGPPTPPLPSASGFAQALQSTEFTVNVVTSGNSQRGRRKGLEEGARTPGPQFPS